jgi:uncharacterized protein YjbI with pentapeptide repeats
VSLWVIVPAGLLILGLMLAAGVAFLRSSWDEPSTRGNLGSGIVAGALIGFVVLGLQVLFDSRFSEADQRRADEAQRREFRFSLERSDDLRGYRPPSKDLSGFVLRDKPMQNANLVGADLTDADLTGSRLRLAHLENTVLTRTKLNGIIAPEVFLTGAHGDGADFSYAQLQGAGLKHAKLLGDSHLDGAQLQGAFLQDATITATISEANFARAHLEGADLSRSEGGSVVFTGAWYDSKTKWPEDYGEPPPPCTRPPCQVPRPSA